MQITLCDICNTHRISIGQLYTVTINKVKIRVAFPDIDICVHCVKKVGEELCK
jgi:hypothetical protein